jgi:hypothetical protein
VKRTNSLAGDFEECRRKLRSLQSFGLRDVVRMHPDDVIALKAWVMAKRRYEREHGTTGREGYVHGGMPG